MQTQDQQLEAGADGWRALFAPEMRGRTLLVCGLQAGVQLSGISAVTFYAADIFQRAGLEERADQLATIQTLVGLIVTALSCILVDLVGRRPLLLTSQALMLPFLGGLVLYFALTSGPEPSVCDASRLGWLAVGSLYCYVAAFCIGTGCLPWLICAEICPLRLRSKATGLATSVSWLTTYMVAQSFRLIANRAGEAGTFGLFLGFTTVFFAFTFFLLPETKGMSLEAIERSFQNRTDEIGSDRSAAKGHSEEASQSAGPAFGGSMVVATPPPVMPPLTPDLLNSSVASTPALASFPRPMAAAEGEGSHGDGKSGSLPIAKIIGFAVVGTGFATWLVSTLIRHPLFPFRIDCGVDEPDNFGRRACIWSRAWLLTTIADYYTMTVCMCGVILSSEQRLMTGAAWSLGCCLLGAPMACVWVCLQLYRRGSLSLTMHAGQGVAAATDPAGMPEHRFH